MVKIYTLIISPFINIHVNNVSFYKYVFKYTVKGKAVKLPSKMTLWKYKRNSKKYSKFDYE